ncbi:MAG: hypothetical protein ACI9G1_004959, partial [Pirellulaceae bacterium]
RQHHLLSGDGPNVDSREDIVQRRVNWFDDVLRHSEAFAEINCSQFEERFAAHSFVEWTAKLRENQFTSVAYQRPAP